LIIGVETLQKFRHYFLSAFSRCGGLINCEVESSQCVTSVNFFRRNIMSTKYKLTAVAVLTGVSLLMLPMAQAKGPADYNAYEDLSGTHASTQYDTKDGMRGREGMAGESGTAGVVSQRMVISGYDAYEDLSGTHAAKRMAQSGAQGPSGAEGAAGAAGRATGPSPLFKIPGDVEDGCSRHLRCSGEY
jgi:hypothetical protein